MLQSSIGYFKFLIFIFIFSGYFILRVDVKKYRKLKMRQESMLARWLGWLNISLGTLSIVLSMMLRYLYK